MRWFSFIGCYVNGLRIHEQRCTERVDKTLKQKTNKKTNKKTKIPRKKTKKPMVVCPLKKTNGFLQENHRKPLRAHRWVLPVGKKSKKNRKKIGKKSRKGNFVVACSSRAARRLVRSSHARTIIKASKIRSRASFSALGKTNENHWTFLLLGTTYRQTWSKTVQSCISCLGRYIYIF